MICDQADELRHLVRQCATEASATAWLPIVVVTAGKGGVGTTTLSANLAIAFARRGRRAVLVEADLDHAAGVSLAGETMRRGSLADVLAARRTLLEALEPGPSGIQVLPAPYASCEAIDWTAAAQTRLIAELERLSPHADVVVVDAGSTRGPFARRFWKAASAVIVVTTLDDTAVAQGYATIKVLSAETPSTPVYTLVNQAVDLSHASLVHARLGETCRRFLGLKLAAGASVERCQQADAGAAGAPIFAARSAAARALDKTADSLWVALGERSARAITFGALNETE